MISEVPTQSLFVIGTVVVLSVNTHHVGYPFVLTVFIIWGYLLGSHMEDNHAHSERVRMQSISTAVNGSAQPSTDDEEDNEADSSGPNSYENGPQNGIELTASDKKAFNVDALAKRGKSKQPVVKKEPTPTPKPSASKKGKKVCTVQPRYSSRTQCLYAVLADDTLHQQPRHVCVCLCSLATGMGQILM